ncbi:hypothetical protein BESB_067000 [Besnoitia besnoiti]|uniref:Uncharacterized protein n=1 Tax=Besnoitia besnoiti TaxID=94643 RepID=A0A2A9MGD7_BESBE|nr:hypothetical protein BESB_067000 [Besnoitia besnoiti]PFH34667.1 hypothetical protein BESB_067000 [Besnoitia besnoiti]
MCVVTIVTEKRPRGDTGDAKNTVHKEPATPTDLCAGSCLGCFYSEDILPGPIKKRRCTDILFLLIFIAGIAASVFITIVAFHKGDPARLLTGRDFDGAFCGMSDFKTPKHPMVGYTLNINRVLGSTSSSEFMDMPYSELRKMTIFSNPKEIMAYMQPICVTSCFTDQDIASLSAGKPQRTLKFAYKGKLLGKFCVPAIAGLNHSYLPFSDYVPERLLLGWQQTVEDLRVSWPAIAVCALVACAMGILWLVAVRLLGGAIVYVAITLFLGAFFTAGGVGMWFVYAQAVPAESVRPGQEPNGTVVASVWIEATRYASYVVLGLGSLFAILLVFLSKRIHEAVAVSKVAAMFIYHKPTAVAVPLITIALQAAYFCFAVYTAACLVTAVDVYPDSLNAILGGSQPSPSLAHRANQSLLSLMHPPSQGPSLLSAPPAPEAAGPPQPRPPAFLSRAPTGEAHSDSSSPHPSRLRSSPRLSVATRRALQPTAQSLVRGDAGDAAPRQQRRRAAFAGADAPAAGLYRAAGGEPMRSPSSVPARASSAPSLPEPTHPGAASESSLQDEPGRNSRAAAALLGSLFETQEKTSAREARLAWPSRLETSMADRARARSKAAQATAVAPSWDAAAGLATGGETARKPRGSVPPRGLAQSGDLPRRIRRGSHPPTPFPDPVLLRLQHELVDREPSVDAELAVLGDLGAYAPRHAVPPFSEEDEAFVEQKTNLDAAPDFWASASLRDSLMDPTKPSIMEVASLYYSSNAAVADSQGWIIEATKRVQMSEAVINLLWCVWGHAAVFARLWRPRCPGTSCRSFGWYHIFMFLCVYCFLLACNQIVLAGAIGRWYFTPEDRTGKKKCRGVVCRSLGVAVKFHLGSLAFGSFLLALIKLIKCFLRFLKKQHYAIHGGGATKACAHCLPCGLGKCCAAISACNSVWAALIGILGYLVKCFERCIEFLDRQAYIQIALTGKNFCRSARLAFKNFSQNPVRIGLALFLGKALCFLGTMVVAAASTAVAFFITKLAYGEHLSSLTYTTFCCGVCNLAVAWIFQEVYRMAISTTIHCYIADLHLSSKTGQPPVFTPEPLRNFLHRGEDD